MARLAPAVNGIDGDDLRVRGSCLPVARAPQPGDQHIAFDAGPVAWWWEGDLAPAAATMFIEQQFIVGDKVVRLDATVPREPDDWAHREALKLASETRWSYDDWRPYLNKIAKRPDRVTLAACVTATLPDPEVAALLDRATS